MAGYAVDPDRSTITAVVRPRMGPPTLPARVTGTVDLDEAALRAAEGTGDRAGEPAGRRAIEASELSGSIEVSLDGQPPVAVDLAAAAADGPADLCRDEQGQLVLRGRRSAPAGAFGILGPPLINPTVVLTWSLVLDPL